MLIQVVSTVGHLLSKHTPPNTIFLENTLWDLDALIPGNLSTLTESRGLGQVFLSILTVWFYAMFINLQCLLWCKCGPRTWQFH